MDVSVSSIQPVTSHMLGLGPFLHVGEGEKLIMLLSYKAV